MIKVIVFDFVGVLVNEKDINLTREEACLEKLFGPNRNDADYLFEARKIISNDALLVRTTENIIDRLYEVKDVTLFDKIKEKYNDLKIVIATNHVSYVRNFIGENLNVSLVDDVIISAEIGCIKPDLNFYQKLIRKLNVLPEEILFIDDNQYNVDKAIKIGMKTIKINYGDNVYNKVIESLTKNN